MTTKFTFFTKVFEESEKAKGLYKDYDFSNLSDNQKYFLKKLSIISKYRDVFKYLALRRSIPDREKNEYIQLYKPNLSYPEYIKYNTVTEEDENQFVNSVYIVGFCNFCAFLYFVNKREAGQSLLKDMGKSVFISFMVGLGYIKYHKMNYRKNLDKLYFTLEERMNSYPELKNNNENKNYVSEDNYNEEVDDSF